MKPPTDYHAVFSRAVFYLVLCMGPGSAMADAAAEMAAKEQLEGPGRGGGHGFDYMIGPYYNVVRPDGAARWQIRYMMSWLFP